MGSIAYFSGESKCRNRGQPRFRRANLRPMVAKTASSTFCSWSRRTRGCLTAGLRFDERESLSGGDDGDALKGLQVAKAVVAGDHKVGLRGNGADEDLIVVRVARHRRW